MMTPEEVAASLPPLSDDQVAQVAALLAMATEDARWNS